MAEMKQYTSAEKQKIAKGLLSVVPGTPGGVIDGVGNMSTDGVDALISSSKKDIDANVRPATQRRSFADVLAGKPDAAAESGAKDRLKEYADLALKGRLSGVREIGSLEAAMAATGFNTSPNGNLSDELPSISKFLDQLNQGMTLGGIFNANAEAMQQQNRLASENAAKVQADAAAQGNLYSKYSAGLVYSGYLKAEDAANPSKAAEALSYMISNTMPPGYQADELKSMFSNIDKMEPNQKALDYIKNHTLANTTGDRLQADLESKDGSRIKMAQAYMALNEVKVDGKDVEINGVIYSQEFADAATSMVRQDIKTPAGTGPNGRPSMQELYGMTQAGQLHLPQGAYEALSRGEQEAANKYPLSKDSKPGDITREGFIAARLIQDNPSKYEALLAAENAQRKDITLNLEINAVAKENVLSAVNENEEKLAAVALPGNFAEVASRYAADNGGSIRVEHIPYVLAQAEGKATTLTGGIDFARAQGARAGLSQEDLSRSISLNPASPEFQGNMEQVLKNAYVLENARAGATMNNFSPEILDGFKQIASTQQGITNSLVEGNLAKFGLPSNFLSHMQNLHADGMVMGVEIANELRVLDPNGAGKRINPANMAGELSRVGLEDQYGKNNPAIDRIVQADNVLNVKDPGQLAVAMQIGVAMKEGKDLGTLYKERPDLQVTTEAVAKGFLGGKAVPQIDAPAADPAKEKQAPAQSENWLTSLSKYFVSRAEAKTPDAAAAAPAKPRIEPGQTYAEPTPWNAMQ